jgi:hypothetical protein
MKKYNRTTTLQSILITGGLILLPHTAQAVEVSISGQVNRLIMDIDNGEESGIVHADNSVSGTRWRLAGEGQITNSSTAGVLYETQLQSNASSNINADNLDGDGINGNISDGDTLSNRQANVWVKGDWGRLTLGQGSGASDGSAEMDDSGTTVIQYSGSSADLFGAMEYGNSGVTVGDVRSNFDGLGRHDNVRYDAALAGGTQLAFSAGNGDKIEAAARFSTQQLKIMLAFWDQDDSGDGIKGSALSASFTGAGGTNLTVAYGTDDRSGDPDNLYVKIGFRDGTNAYAIDWSETTGLGPGDANSYSIAWVGAMAQGVEVYFTYQVESLDDVSGADDVEAIAGGMRIKF